MSAKGYMILFFLVAFQVQADSNFFSLPKNYSWQKGIFVAAGMYAIGEVAYRRYCKFKKASSLKNRGTLETIEAIVGRIITSLGLVNSNDLRSEFVKLEEKLENHVREHHKTLNEDDIKTLVTAAFQEHMEANFALYENVMKGIAHDVVDDMIKSLERRIEVLEEMKNKADMLSE